MVQSEATASSGSSEHRPIVIDDRDIPWHDAVMARIEHLCRLRPGWDGYDAPPVDFSTANFALRILSSVCAPSTPSPSIVPGTNGDLQIEWHTAIWDMEIHVLAPNHVEAWRGPADRRDADEEALEATVDFTALYDWVKALAEPALADLVPTAR